MRSSSFGFLYATFLTGLAAQSWVPSFVTSGTGCPSANAPTLSMTPAPAIGTTAVLLANQLPQDTVSAVAILGASPATLALDHLGAPGCTVQVLAQLSIPMLSATRAATLPFTIPGDTELLGVTVEVQTAALAPSSNRLGLALSDRGTMYVGSPHVAAGPFINSTNGRRYLVLTQDTWQANEAKARSLGGHLVTIDDMAENTWVTTTLAGLGGWVGTQVWIGLSRSPTTPWQWASGSPTAFVNWAPGEPNNATGSEFCVALYPVGNQWGSAGQWNDAPGGWSLHAVVEL